MSELNAALDLPLSTAAPTAARRAIRQMLVAWRMTDETSAAPRHGRSGAAMLTITEGRDGGALALALDGELDLSTHADLAAALEKAIATADVAAIVVDCERLRFCDSTGVQTLLVGLRRATAEGRSLRLVGVRGLVARVLTICGAMAMLTGDPAPA